MQSFIAIIFALAQLTNPAWGSVKYDQALGYVLPEVVVTAERYNAPLDPGVNQTRVYYDPVLGWTLPAMIVNASRPEPLNARTIAGKVMPTLAFADDGIKVKTIPASQTFSGNYTLGAGDTLKDDLTVTGGTANVNGVIIGDLSVMGGEAFATGKVDGDVAVFGGNLLITGTITGDASVLGGNIRNKGTIEGDVFLMGGRMALDSGSVVEGAITTIGGNIERDTNALIRGEIKTMPLERMEKYLPRFSKLWRIRPHLGAFRLMPAFIVLTAELVIFLLNLLILAIFPAAVDKIKHKITDSVWLAAAIGIAFKILLIPIILLFAVSIIGIPLIPVFLLALLVAIWFGVTALSSVLGEKIAQGFKWNVTHKIGTFSLGWLALKIIPILGLLLAAAGFPLVLILGLTIHFVMTTIALGASTLALFKKEIEGK
jgi:hypothetical protein